MGLYDEALGALLVGTWANAMLYTLQISQTIKYYKTFPSDRLPIKLIVGLSMFVDTLGTVNNCICVYLYTISHWGDAPYLLTQGWTIPAYLVLSSISAVIVQSFLTWRFWHLTRLWMVTIVLGALALTAFGGALVNAATVVRYSAYEERDKNIKTVTIWLVCSAVADIAIAGALVWQLRNVKTTFSATHSLIKRLIVSAVSTGSATSVLAVICLIFYLINTKSNITVGFGFTLGRAYTLTMLFNLNTREMARRRNAGSSANTGSGLHEHERERAHHIGGVSNGGISVHRTAIVHIDEGAKDDFYSGTPEVGQHSDSKDIELAPYAHSDELSGPKVGKHPYAV